MAKVQGNGISVGGKIKVGFPKTGTKKDGSMWQLFTYKETKKNQQTGEYDEIGRYTIFVNNPQPNLKNGDMITIKNITKSLMEKNIVNNKEYININCWCEIEIINNTNNDNQGANQNQPQFEENNQQMETPSFSDEFVDSLDLPF